MKFYKGKILKSVWFKKPSFDFFETQDLSSPNIPAKKLCSTYGLQFFSWPDTGQDRCVVQMVWSLLRSNWRSALLLRYSVNDLAAKSGQVFAQRRYPIILRKKIRTLVAVTKALQKECFA